MALTQTPLCDFGWKARDFDLTGVDKKNYSLQNSSGKNGTLVMFICNHCPYVLAIIDRLLIDIKIIQNNEIGVIAIMPNATELVPQDSFEQMITFSKNHGFSFPYVVDTEQKVSYAYKAMCTPDFFGFNSSMELQYRGRFDNAGLDKPDDSTKKELLNAMVTISQTGKGPKEQEPSMGCSIKWR